MSEDKNIKLSGNLYSFFERGMEGVQWSIQIPSRKKNALYLAETIESIETGDHLTVISDEDQIVFDSIIVRTKTNNLIGKPTYSGFQQIAGAHSCEWLQHGFDPDFWSYIFDNNFRATLTKNVYSEIEINSFLEQTPCTDDNVSYSKKVFNQCHMRPLNEKPIFPNSLIEIGKLEFENEDLDYYNAQLFFLKIESIFNDTNLNHIWLTTDGQLFGFNSAEYKLDSYPNDNDFEYFTNVYEMNVPELSEFLPKAFFGQISKPTKELTDTEIAMLDKAKRELRQAYSKIYFDIKNVARTFKMKQDGKYLHSCLIKIR